jgi:hypothetical protein
MSKERELIGHVGVDAGCIQIGDPCYTHGKDGNWSDYCDKVLAKMDEPHANDHYKNFAQVPYDMGHEGKAIVVGSGYGDGFYPVTVTRNDEGRIASVLVTFLDDEDRHPYEEGFES